MDGVEDVNFRDLQIYDLYEAGALGSDFCGEYWTANEQPFSGGGHFLQNEPYNYGYTGNRVHGMYTDWANVIISGNFEIHNLVSETGLVRGMGLYTNTRMVFDDDVTFSIHDLAAGTSLSEVETDALSHPYAPAEAKPIHLLDYWYDDLTGTYTSEIIGDEEVITPASYCLFGRDGVNISDWSVLLIDDEMDCTLSATTIKSVKPNAMELAVTAKRGDKERYSIMYRNFLSLLNYRITPLMAASTVTIVLVVGILYRVCRNRANTKSKTLPTEIAPLLTITE